MLRLRRSPWLRLIAVLFLAGSPGLGGAALQALHGCTEQMPWLSGHDAGVGHEGDAAPAHHGGGEQGAPAESGCHCIGHCQATPAMATTGSATLSEIDVLPSAGAVLSGESRVAPAGRIAHRLPPATAPPLS